MAQSPRHDRIGRLLATALGVAALGGWVPALAQARLQSREAAPQQEVVITARRLADEALTGEVLKALEDDPYIYSAHMSVVTENGIVHLQGIALDASDLYRALYLARRIAGTRRVVNEVEFITWGADLY